MAMKASCFRILFKIFILSVGRSRVFISTSMQKVPGSKLGLVVQFLLFFFSHLDKSFVQDKIIQIFGRGFSRWL